MTPELSPSGVPQSESAVLVDLYGRAYDRLESIVRNPQGRTQGSREFRQARAAQQIRQVDDLLGELGARRARWTDAATVTAYADGVARGDRQAVAAGVRPAALPAAGSFSQIDHEAVRVFAHDIASDLAGAERSMGEATKRVLRVTAQQAIPESRIDQILAGGVIDGTPPNTLKELRTALEAVTGKTIDVPTKGGGVMTFKVSHYANLVATTKTRQATVVARHNRLSRLGLDLVVIIGALSKNFCTAFLGQGFSISGRHPKYPPLSSLPGGGPPFHPLCSKSTRPYTDDLATADQRENAAGLDDAHQLLGMTTAEAQRQFKSLQIEQQVRANYGKGYIPPAPKEVAGVRMQPADRPKPEAGPGLVLPRPTEVPPAPTPTGVTTVVVPAIPRPTPAPVAAPAAADAIPLSTVLNKTALRDLRSTGGTLGDHQAQALFPVGRVIEHRNAEGTYRLRVVEHEDYGRDNFGNPKVLPRFAIDAAPADATRLNGQPSLGDLARDAHAEELAAKKRKGSK